MRPNRFIKMSLFLVAAMAMGNSYGHAQATSSAGPQGQASGAVVFPPSFPHRAYYFLDHEGLYRG
jgi:hypothetical protein